MRKSGPFDFLSRNPLVLPVAGVIAVLGGLLFWQAGGDVVDIASAKLRHRIGSIEVSAAAPSSAAPTIASPAPLKPLPDGPFVVRSILKIDGPIKYGQFYWDESKGPSGPTVITVDLAARTLSVFRDGHEIGATAILKGYGDKPTPLGVFPIMEKDADHVSNIYDAPMPYMLRMTNDGVSIHGANVRKGYATNGCVGVPEEFARRLFAVTKVGDRIIVTDGKRIGVGDPIMVAAPGSKS
ncbi:L,D-transpeptidase family protein [Novosphingobium olei]|uniref:L,D-transpeptidase family protein n=1 Tax=Novosphingobium olei TaxID=2728851 RepID=UPI00308DD8DB|nr:L,D-transpeptidase family protein [Novosphingobium olei]